MPDLYTILQSMMKLMTTGERTTEAMEEPPAPGREPRFPHKDEFALNYYSSTSVSLMPTIPYRFPLPCKLLTIAQTCRKTLVLSLMLIVTGYGVDQGLRPMTRARRYMAVVLLLVLPLVLRVLLPFLPVLLVVLLLLRQGVDHLVCAWEIWGSARRRHHRAVNIWLCMTMVLCMYLVDDVAFCFG